MQKLLATLVLNICFLLAALLQAQAEYPGARTLTSGGPPPVRIAVIAGGGSGMEQDVVDQITNNLQLNPHVKISTVNPDWYVQCNIFDRTDTGGASVRANGTVVIKTVDNTVLNTVSVQTNKQDFSVTPGMPVNKALFDRGVREVIQSLIDRSRQPLADAIDIEMDTREKLMKAQMLGDDDKYGDGLQILMSVSQDSPHFAGARKMIDEFQMEQDANSSLKEGKALAQKGQYSKAIDVLKVVSPRSKKASLAKNLIAKYRAAVASHRTTASHGAAVSHSAVPAHSPIAQPKNKKSGEWNSSEQLKALETKKKALDAERKALEDQESALRKSK